MKISKFFDSKEFECKCGCGFWQVDKSLLALLNELRMLFDAPIIVNSGCRCSKHNKKIGGSPRSQHLLGKAADIVVKGKDPKEIYEYIDKTYIGFGIGLYDSFVHVDTREKKTRWNFQTKDKKQY